MMNNSIEIVMILYGCTLEESETYQSIVPLLEDLTIEYEFILFNNDDTITIEHPKYVVVNSKENVKIVGGYNFALKRAVENEMQWILLLDQDTVIPNNYFSKLTKLFTKGYKKDLVAIAPTLSSSNNILSPKRIGSKMRFDYDLGTLGYTKQRMNAFNSLSLFKVHFFESIGGFPHAFPLDMHDHWCYHQIYKHKKSCYILDVTATHNSSFVDFEENVSPKRYRLFIRAESKFIRDELGIKDTIYYKIKLLFRSVKQLIKNKNKKFASITFSYIFK